MTCLAGLAFLGSPKGERCDFIFLALGGGPRELPLGFKIVSHIQKITEVALEDSGSEEGFEAGRQTH